MCSASVMCWAATHDMTNKNRSSVGNLQKVCRCIRSSGINNLDSLRVKPDRQCTAVLGFMPAFLITSCVLVCVGGLGTSSGLKWVTTPNVGQNQPPPPH